MATFVEDPNGHDVDVDLLGTADWDYLGDTVPEQELKVTSGTTPVGDRFFRRADSDSIWGAAHWSGVGDHADVEILMLMRTHSQQVESWLRTDIAHIDNDWRSSGNSAGVVLQKRRGVDSWRFREYIGGTNQNSIDDHANPEYGSAWFWVRIRLNGSTGEVWHWEDGGTEPSTPNLSGTLTTHLSAGAVVISLDRFDHFDFAWISLGTDGDTAPGPEGDVSGVAGTLDQTAPSFTQSAAGETTIVGAANRRVRYGNQWWPAP